jgi:hypothetical protein
MTHPCRHCGDDLPEDSPASVTSCRGYADWRARQMGDMLPAEEADMLGLFAGLCALDVATRDGLEMLPELPA